jgi:hypothetical protein
MQLIGFGQGLIVVAVGLWLIGPPPIWLLSFLGMIFVLVGICVAAARSDSD